MIPSRLFLLRDFIHGALSLSLCVHSLGAELLHIKEKSIIMFMNISSMSVTIFLFLYLENPSESEDIIHLINDPECERSAKQNEVRLFIYYINSFKKPTNKHLNISIVFLTVL